MNRHLQVRNASMFFAAHLLSAFGYEFAFFVMTLHVYGRRGSASDVALFSTLTFLPRLLSPFLGSLVDRHSEAKLFATTLALGAAFTILIPFTPGGPWELVTWAGVAVLSVLFGIVRSALLTRVLEKGGYVKGNSAMLISLNTAKLASPLVGAFAAACLSFRVSLAGAGAVFLLAAVSAWSLKLERREQSMVRTRGRIFSDFRYGFAELWRSGQLRFAFLLAFAWRLFLGLQISLFVVFVKKTLGGSDADYGLFMTYLGLGSLLGSLASPWIAERLSRTWLLNGGMGLHFTAFVLLSWSSTWVAAVVIGVLGSVILYTVVVGAHALRDQATPEAFRGRVFGANAALLSVATMASMLAGGRLADAYGVSNVFLGAGVLSLVSLVLLNVLFRPSGVAAQPEM